MTDSSAPGQDPHILDTSVPHSARVWSYWLGGKDNYQADRMVGDQVMAMFPDITRLARADRARNVRRRPKAVTFPKLCPSEHAEDEALASLPGLLDEFAGEAVPIHELDDRAGVRCVRAEDRCPAPT